MVDTTTTPFACSRCGLRQDAGERCTSCRHDCVLDLRDGKNVEFLREADRKRKRAHLERSKKLAVAIAMVLVMATWFIPGFWDLRRRFFALPLLLDQLLLTSVIGGALWQLLERRPPRPVFPYLEEKLVA